MEMDIGSKALPFLKGSSDRVLTIVSTAGYISSYGLINIACGKLIGVDANLIELRCPQYKGSTNCPGRDSLNTVSARMEEFIGYL